MKRALTQEEIDGRVDKLREWLDWMQASYEALLSRVEETSSSAGFDSDPDQRPCEHRAEWRRGRLCLACDNTGWRKATKTERTEGLTIDPYSVELPKTGWRPNDPESAVKAGHQALINDTIRVLERNEKVRNGEEALPDAALGKYLRIYRKPQGYTKVVKGLTLLQTTLPRLYDDLPSPEALRAIVILMHRVVGGRFPNPPSHD